MDTRGHTKTAFSHLRYVAGYIGGALAKKIELLQKTPGLEYSHLYAPRPRFWILLRRLVLKNDDHAADHFDDLSNDGYAEYSLGFS